MSLKSLIEPFKSDRVKLKQLKSLVDTYLDEFNLDDKIQLVKTRLIPVAVTYELQTLLECVKCLKYFPNSVIFSFNGRILKLLNEYMYIDDEMICHEDSWSRFDVTECEIIKNRFRLHDTSIEEISKFFTTLVKI